MASASSSIIIRSISNYPAIGALSKLTGEFLLRLHVLSQHAFPSLFSGDFE
jgi:hypothetical protein